MISKRRSLRFSCAGQHVSYKTAYDAGEAQLLNISAEGCAFIQPTSPLFMREKVLVSLLLPDINYLFQAQGVVVRVESSGCIAVHFTLVEPEDQLIMRKSVAQLMRKR